MIAVTAGVAFFAAEHRWYYQPDVINPDVTLDIFSTEQMKARAAIRRVLLDPNSAQFSALRSVEKDEARFVCGAVKARDKTGQLATAAFVYTVAIDFARIDDDGRITHQRAPFRPCPVTEEEAFAQQKSAVSPGALSIAQNVQKVAPKVNSPAVSALTRLAGSSGETSGGHDGAATRRTRRKVRKCVRRGGRKEGQTRRSRPVSTTNATGAPTVRRLHGRYFHWITRWRNRRGSAPAAEALALAKDVEERWEQAKSPASSKLRPSSEEIREACRALLSVDHGDTEFPKAWAAFVRLRKIDREMAG